MIERVECEGCGRSIDAAVRQCPYCNVLREPGDVVGTRRENTIKSTVTPPRVERRKPSGDREIVRKLVFGGAALLLLIGVFLIGAFVRSLGVDKPEVYETEEVEGPQVANSQPRTDLNLISDPSAAAIGRSYTSRSPIDVDLTESSEFDRADATALPESVYRNIAEQEEAREARRYESVDPRDVTESVRPRRRRPEPEDESEEPASQATSSDTSVRTNPRPLSQPVPPVRTRAEGVVRLQLTISPSGSVEDIRVLESLSGVTPTIVQAARNWTFSPATENGRPVEGTYQVAIRINQDD